jgi:hypothetical protein
MDGSLRGAEDRPLPSRADQFAVEGSLRLCDRRLQQVLVQDTWLAAIPGNLIVMNRQDLGHRKEACSITRLAAEVQSDIDRSLAAALFQRRDPSEPAR